MKNAGLIMGADWMMIRNVFFFLWVILISLFAPGAPKLFAAEILSLQVNEGEFRRLEKPVQDVLITNPDVADIQLTQGNSLFIYAKQPGKTQIVAVGEGDRVLLDRIIVVTRDLAHLQQSLRSEFPGEPVVVTGAGGRVVLTGKVSSPVIMDQILLVISGFLDKEEKIVNKMTLNSSVQVNLRVRIMEMNRQAREDLGLNWNALFNPGNLTIGLLTGRTPSSVGNLIIPNPDLTGGGGSALLGYKGRDASLNAVIDALEEDELITVLAEPNLTSRSGETASFFAGGEFPIPVAASEDRITIEFKKFGVILDMTPTVLSDNRIRLHIRPEVSELSSAGAVIIQDIAVPGISVRRTEATIELASGQSFSVAGLMRNENRNLVQDVPWLADLDVIGPLFRSRKFRRSETELVIIATANIVRPLSHDRYQLPSDQLDIQLPRQITKTGKILSDRKGSQSPVFQQPAHPPLKGGRGYIF
ncbi:MAG: type II and III secretion system protein family protein [Sneathiellales bacterium]|nr:type II and III secretion system protein family protein [Sneathiellales bacterium]